MSVPQTEPDSDIITDALAQDICERFFEPSHKQLMSLDELLRSYGVVLQSDEWIMRLFDLPLSSDSHANMLSRLFSIPQPQIKEHTATGATSVHWADVARVPTYAPTRQEDGTYHLLLPGSKILVEPSKLDHDLMETRIPRQVVDPKSYPCDMSAEIKATWLVTAQITQLKKSLLQLSETAENVLSHLSSRRQVLQGHETTLCSRDTSPQAVAHATPLGKSSSINGKKRKGRRGIKWSPQEDVYVVEWFQQNQGLAEQQVEEKYHSDTGISRSYDSLQTRLYLLGSGHLTHKKRKTSTDVTSSFPSNSRAEFIIPLTEAVTRIKGASRYVEPSEAGQDGESSDSHIEGMNRESPLDPSSHHSVNTAKLGNSRGEPDEEESTHCSHVHENKQSPQEQHKVGSIEEIMDDLPERLYLSGAPVALENSSEYPPPKIPALPHPGSRKPTLPGISDLLKNYDTWRAPSHIFTGQLVGNVDMVDPPPVADNSQSGPRMPLPEPQTVLAFTSTSFSQSSSTQSSFTEPSHGSFPCLKPGCESRKPYKYEGCLRNHERKHHS